MHGFVEQADVFSSWMIWTGKARRVIQSSGTPGKMAGSSGPRSASQDVHSLGFGFRCIHISWRRVASRATGDGSSTPRAPPPPPPAARLSRPSDPIKAGPEIPGLQPEALKIGASGPGSRRMSDARVAGALGHPGR